MRLAGLYRECFLGRKQLLQFGRHRLPNRQRRYSALFLRSNTLAAKGGIRGTGDTAAMDLGATPSMPARHSLMDSTFTLVHRIPLDRFLRRSLKTLRPMAQFLRVTATVIVFRPG